MEEQTITQFGWGVSEELDDDTGELMNRTLHITVLAALPFAGPDGNPVHMPVRVIHLPFGRMPSGRWACDNLALAMRGEEIPPEVQIARPSELLGHRGPNGVPRS